MLSTASRATTTTTTAATRQPDTVIEPRGPFSWAAALDVFGNFGPIRRHWRWSTTLRLAFPLDGTFEPVAVAITERDGALELRIAGTDRIDAVARQVARIFSLDYDGTAYPAVGERDPEIGRLITALPGLRPVCFTSPYETAAWAIVSQRISMRQAAVIQDRLIAEHGESIEIEGEMVRAFPHPEQLLRLTQVPGLSAEKVERLRGVGRAALDGRLDIDRLRALGEIDGPESLRAIRGIGPFWSSGIYLRGCGIADAFPAEPLSIAALGITHGLGENPSAADVERLSEVFRPFRMWVCFLLRVAANRELVPGIRGREMAIRRSAPMG